MVNDVSGFQFFQWNKQHAILNKWHASVMAPSKLAPRQQTLLHIVSVHQSAEMSNNNELLEKPKKLVRVSYFCTGSPV